MPKIYDFIFSSKNVGMISYTLYISSATMVSCTGMKTKEHLMQKNRKKKVVQVFWHSVFLCFLLLSNIIQIYFGICLCSI